MRSKSRWVLESMVESLLTFEYNQIILLAYLGKW
jgi:hypothetical protein